MSGVMKLIEEVRESATFSRAQHASLHDLQLLRELVAWREKQGLRQKDVAALMGVSQQQISKLERHDSDPQLSTLRKYANALGVVIHHEILDDAELQISATSRQSGAVLT